MDFSDSEVTLATSSLSLRSYPFYICLESIEHSTGRIQAGLVPLLIPTLISSWITPILILRHRIVLEMMEDQIMISICMNVKGCETGFEAALWHPFPISLFCGCISPLSWVIVLTRPAHPLHTSPCRSFSHRSHPHHQPFQLACLSSGIPARVPQRSFG